MDADGSRPDVKPGTPPASTSPGAVGYSDIALFGEALLHGALCGCLAMPPVAYELEVMVADLEEVPVTWSGAAAKVVLGSAVAMPVGAVVALCTVPFILPVIGRARWPVRR